MSMFVDKGKVEAVSVEQLGTVLGDIFNVLRSGLEEHSKLKPEQERIEANVETTRKSIGRGGRIAGARFRL